MAAHRIFNVQWGSTALLTAAEGGHSDCVRLLVHSGFAENFNDHVRAVRIFACIIIECAHIIFVFILNFCVGASMSFVFFFFLADIHCFFSLRQYIFFNCVPFVGYRFDFMVRLFVSQDCCCFHDHIKYRSYLVKSLVLHVCHLSRSVCLASLPMPFLDGS